MPAILNKQIIHALFRNDHENLYVRNSKTRDSQEIIDEGVDGMPKPSQKNST